MTHNPERYEVPERIKAIISTTDPDKREELDDWLAECNEAQFEKYLELTGSVSQESAEVKDPEDDDDERY